MPCLAAHLTDWIEWRAPLKIGLLGYWTSLQGCGLLSQCNRPPLSAQCAGTSFLAPPLGHLHAACQANARPHTSHSDAAMAQPLIARKVGEGVDRPNVELPLDINYKKLIEWLVRPFLPSIAVTCVLHQAAVRSCKVDRCDRCR